MKTTAPPTTRRSVAGPNRGAAIRRRSRQHTSAGTPESSIDFPGYSGEQGLEPITWDEFFDKFEEKHLAFLYQDMTAEGQTSRFFKLVDRGSLQ